jgi:membrane-bound metal-dependent hydrolase YbcI (DUF457 family)
LGGRTIAVSFVALVIGSWGPDLFTKWFVHGLSFAGLDWRASDPVRFHRGWPGAGFTHSLMFGVLVGAVVFVTTRSKPWALGLMLGLWLHCLSDVEDSVGVMLFFPFTTHVYSLGMWANVDAASRVSDAAAYYSGIGGVWDAFWVVLALLSWRIFARSYFLERVAPRDGFWARIGRWLPEDALLAIYRGAVFFGVCRFAGWMLWAHALHHYPFDISWGGPHWVHAGQLR